MTDPLGTPGGDREDAAIEAGLSVGEIVDRLVEALLDLIVPAMARVRSGIPIRSMERSIDAEGQALIDEAVRQVKVQLAAHGHKIVTQTTDALGPAVTGHGKTAHGHLALPVGSYPSPIDPTMPDIADSIRAAGLDALRRMDDNFRRAAEMATANGSSGTQAAQKMLDELMGNGLSAFTDKAGREWDLSVYAEMATRTAASRLALNTQLALMGPKGFDLVVVDAPSGEVGCRKCAPYEGRVLSLTGKTTTGLLVSVHDANGSKKSANVTGSLAEAVAEGFMHPNCRHFLLPFIDGAGSLPLAGGPRGFVRHGNPIYRLVIPPKDSRAYDVQQQQRELERAVRDAIRRKSIALSPQAKAKANADIAASRRMLKQHVADFHQTRQRYRENPFKAR